MSGPACASKFSFRSRRTSSSRASSARPVSVRAAVGELGLEERGERARAVLAASERRRGPEVGEAAFALLDDEPGVLEQAEVPRHAGLGDSEDARQLADVQALGRQQAQNAQPGVVAEQPEEAGGLMPYL